MEDLKRNEEHTDPSPRNGFKTGRTGGEGGRTKGLSSCGVTVDSEEAAWTESSLDVLGDVGEETVIETLSCIGDQYLQTHSPLSLSGYCPLILLLRLNKRRWVEDDSEGCGVGVYEILPETLLLSLSTVFSTTLDMRFTRLGAVVASLWSSERDWEREVPRVSWEVSFVGAAVES